MCEFCEAHSDESSPEQIRTELMTKWMSKMRENRAATSCGCGCDAESGEGEDAFSRQAMMMMEIMPNKLDMILPAIPREERPDFVLRMLSILMKKGCEGMSGKDKEELVKRACAA